MTAGGKVRLFNLTNRQSQVATGHGGRWLNKVKLAYPVSWHREMSYFFIPQTTRRIPGDFPQIARRGL